MFAVIDCGTTMTRIYIVDDYEGIQDLLIFRSGTQEWLVTWNDHHKDGAVYTYEP